MKIIAFYLPQFHAFPENDKWWGKGFTEWTNTRKAKPLYKGHYEPREPLNDYYYNLLDPKTFEWQIDLANTYGIYGFCFYHYWFSEKILMKQPLEMFLANKALNKHFCICWANETWSRRWNGQEQDILIKQEHGDEKEWISHYKYLFPFFKDERYIRIDGKPLFVLYKPEIFPEYAKMFKLWDEMAKIDGLPGLSFAIQSAIWNTDSSVNDENVDYRIMFEPGYTGLRKGHSFRFTAIYMLLELYAKINPFFQSKPISYIEFTKDIISRPVTSNKQVPGMFVNWDNTPRKKNKGSTTLFNSPDKFQDCLVKLIKKTQTEYKKDMIFLNAWNEWAEGCYLEPDKKYGYSYLEAVKNALVMCDEFPKEL